MATIIRMLNVTTTRRPTTVFDDFFVRAILAGVGVALVAGPLGCFIVWRRLAYYGDTLSHSALLGVALALLLDINMSLAVFVVALLVSFSLLLLQKRGDMSADSLLGLLSHSALSLGLVVLAAMTWLRVDLMGFLFGDILAVTATDLLIIYGGGGTVLLVLGLIWRRLFASTVNEELAQAEGVRPDLINFAFMLLMAIVIAIAMKVVGVLLITALLIIPAVTARRFANSPEQMAVLAALAGVLAVITGLFGSLTWDTPSGPSIVVAATLWFLLSLSPVGGLLRHRKIKDNMR